MAEIQKINPETAAHNIATLFSNQYIKKLKNPIIFSAEFNDADTAAKEAAKLYATVYDSVFEYISHENDMD